jgi:hypothetical protein
MSNDFKRSVNVNSGQVCLLFNIVYNVITFIKNYNCGYQNRICLL